MKMTWLGLCIGLSVLLLHCSCEKEVLSPMENAISQDKIEFKKKEAEQSVVLEHHGYYVNDFYNPDDANLNILGDMIKEDQLLNWTQSHQFNSISLYTVGKILATGNSTLIGQLQDFVAKAKNQYSLDVVFSAGGLSGINRIKNYCTANANNADFLPTGIVTEYEFWNNNTNGNPNSFYVFLEMLDILEEIIIAHDLERSFLYIFKFEDKNWNEVIQDQSDDSGDSGPVGYCPADVMELVLTRIKEIGEDRLYLSFVHYRPNAQNFPPITSTYYKRLQRLANMAAAPVAPGDFEDFPHCSYDVKLDMDLNVVVLYNVNNNSTTAANIWPYFDVNNVPDGNKEFDQAFINFEDGLDLSSMTNKDRIKLKGSQLYRYTEAREARP